MKVIQNTDCNFGVSYNEPSDELENDAYIGDLTKVEEEGDYDWYHFYPDSSF